MILYSKGVEGLREERKYSDRSKMVSGIADERQVLGAWLRKR